MIIDTIENLYFYEKLHRNFSLAFQYLSGIKLNNLDLGKHPLQDENLGYIIISKNECKNAKYSYLEAHQKYIDIQIVLDGTEQMGWKGFNDCKTIHLPYDEEKDIKFFTDSPDFFVNVKSKQFVIFFPCDAHMPLIGTGVSYKAIVKIRC